MSSELNFKHLATGATICALVKGVDRTTRWNGSAFVPIASIADADWPTGLIALTEQLTADSTPTAAYVGDFPTAIPAGEYAIEYYEGGTPAPGDLAVGYQVITWNGDSEITLGSVEVGSEGLDDVEPFEFPTQGFSP